MSGRVTKEKNILTLDLSAAGSVRIYYIDIQTGIITTKTGKVLGNGKKPVGYTHLSSCEGWERILFNFFYYNETFTTDELAIMLQCCELLYSVGIDCNKYDVFDLRKDISKAILDKKKYLSKWVKENQEYLNGRYYGWWDTFISYATYQDGLAQRGYWAKQLNGEQFKTIIERNRLQNNLSNEDLEVYGYYLLNNSYIVELTTTAWVIDKIKDYLFRCKLMGKKPEHSANMFREFAECNRTYEAYQKKYNDKHIRENLAKHSKAWEFSYGDYTIVVPTCGQDIVREGELMHHCVGGYVDNVAQGITNIVFVRNKAELDKPYITCQVHTNGTIGQYFLAYDRHISKTEDIEFKNAFQEHLNKVWNN